MKKFFLVILFLLAISMLAVSCATPPNNPTIIPTPTPTPTVQEKFEQSLSGSSNKTASFTLWIIGAIPFLLAGILGYNSIEPKDKSQSYIVGILVSSISGILAGFVVSVDENLE